MQYVIKKRLGGGERLHYKCNSCAADLESPLSDAGKRDTCPLCGESFIVPGLEEVQARAAEQYKREAQARQEAEEKARQVAARRVEAVRGRAERQPVQDMSRPAAALDGKLTFEGQHTPQVAMLNKEQTVDVFEAGFWDLGILGWLFGHKRRLVLTTHRLFRFEKRLIDNRLDILWLPRVKGVIVGHVLSGRMLALAIALLLGTIGLMVNPPPGISGVTKLFLVLLMVTVVALLIIYARRKVMVVSTGEDKAGLKLTRLGSEESSRLVNKIFAVLQRFEPG